MTGDRAARMGGRRWIALLEGAGVPLGSVVLAVGIGSIFVLASGRDPGLAFAALFNGAFGGARQIGETLMRATPLILTGLAVAYGFRAGLFNIGAEGQLFLGGLAAASLGIAMAGLPWWINAPCLLAGAALAGAAWAYLPAVLKARVGAHEVITTMMFSYIGRYLVSWLVTGPLKAPGQIPQTAALPPESTLPRISDAFPFLPASRAHLGILVALAAAVATWWVLKRTVLGFEARAVGFNPLAAETSGISVRSTTVRSLCISGGLAGLAGAVEVMGVHGRLFDQSSSGFGFTGIAVALLARNNPLGVLASALLFGALSAGAGTMQLEADVPQKLVLILQAVVIFVVGAESILRRAIRHRRRGVPQGA